MGDLLASQAPSAVVMVRPHRFVPNPETLMDNAFQGRGGGDIPELLNECAFDEVTRVVEALEEAGVRVHLFEDEGGITPDSVFPNNWFTTHADGRVVIYPMYAPNRRKERRQDIIEMLKREYLVREILDYSSLEYEEIFLEGTGALVIDHANRVAYVARSRRADPVAIERICSRLSIRPIVFEAYDDQRVPVYHTNVLMCVATRFVLISLKLIEDEMHRRKLIEQFHDAGREIIDLSPDQVFSFAGNAMELKGWDRNWLAMSDKAVRTLTPSQRQVIGKSADILPLHVPTIELAGGSVRCMLAGVHLAPRVCSSVKPARRIRSHRGLESG